MIEQFVPSNRTSAHRALVIVSHAGGSPYHGPNMRSYYLGRLLVDAGWQVTLVSSSEFHKYHSPPKVNGNVTVEEIDGIRYIWLKTPAYRQGSVKQIVNQLCFAFRAGKREISRLIGSPSAVIASSPHPFVIFSAKRLADEARCALIYETRDLWPLVLRELSGWPRWHPYLLALSLAERMAVRWSDRIIGVKRGDLDYFHCHYGVEPERLIYLPNGFDARHVLREPLDEGAAANLTKAGFIIGYVGAVSAHYEFETLLKALADPRLRDTDIRLRIVGAGSDLSKLRARAEVLGLSNVDFIGPIPKAQVLSAISTFDVCYVGLKEGRANRHGVSANKIYEYMYAAKPILAVYNTSDDPVAASGCGITVRPGDVEPLVEGIRQLVGANPASLESMGRRGYFYMMDHHELGKIASRLARVVEELDSSILPSTPSAVNNERCEQAG